MWVPGGLGTPVRTRSEPWGPLPSVCYWNHSMDVKARIDRHTVGEIESAPEGTLKPRWRESWQERIGPSPFPSSGTWGRAREASICWPEVWPPVKESVQQTEG